MKILTFDTALNKTYISLNEDNKCIENVTIENTDDKYHSAFLIQEIANTLKKHGLKMQDINAVGINVGPGSFTGIRACTTVGRVIAQQIEVPLVPVSSLEIISRIKKEVKTLVTLDARKGLAFFGVYENGLEIEAPQMVKVEELFDKIGESFVISDSNMYQKLKEKGIDSVNYEVENYPMNTYLANITFEKLNTSSNFENEFHWAKAKPLYIQPPSVFGQPLKLN